MTKILIKNGTSIDGQKMKHPIVIMDGMIVSVDGIPEGFIPETVIDASQLIVSPGFIDLAAHLREPGYEHKAKISTETKACAKSGITTVCCMPDTDPIIDTPAVAELIIQRAQHAGYCQVLPIGALTKDLKGEQLSEMHALYQAGCVALSNAGFPILDTAILRHCFDYAATFDMCVFIRPEDYWLARHGCSHEGKVSTRLGLNGIPSSAESIEVARCIQLAELTGTRIHFSQISAYQSVELIKQAQVKGLAVTADVAAHQLVLTEDHLEHYQSSCHVNPPLRTTRDKDALIAGLNEGVIGAVVSAHQPHEADAKLQPFAQASPGISGIETLLPILLHLVKEQHFSLAFAMSLITQKPANILGLARGRIEPGYVADLCLFDAQHSFVFDAADMISMGKNTPFSGWTFQGKVMYTLMSGKIVYAHTI